MKELKRREFLEIAGAGGAWATAALAAAGAEAKTEPGTAPDPIGTYVSGRPDGRFVQTAGFLHKSLQNLQPRLAFSPDITRQALPAWQKAVREKLLELMCFPAVEAQPEPRRIWSQPRQGYRLERWESYPEPWSVVPFLLLVPDGVSAASPAPAVMCFPGSTGSKEALAGEPELPGSPAPDKTKWDDNRMAFHFARRGLIAAAFDNPATNELASPLLPRESLTLCALWMGRCYEAISVFQKACVLQWLVTQPYVDPTRVATSGHSLGAKPADILGVLYPELVQAVVHNDFVCHWQERAVAVNLYHPGGHQVVPGMFQWFDYTDLEAALAPRPLLFTEGGRPSQVAKIRRAYALLDAADRVRLYQYEKYEDPASRTLDEAELPVGISDQEYFVYAYVDAPRHRFRPQRAVPWLAEVFRM
ncbi:MAG: alpha/beta hydrolase family protein [Thermoguttaceae bacterium]